MSKKPVNEDSVAAETIKIPQQNKSQMLGAALAKLAGLDIEDLSHFLNDTLAQVSDNSSSLNGGGAPDASAQNQASINMKPSAAMRESVKSDLANILGEGEELSEEVRDQAASLFESALEARLIVERESLIEEMNDRLEEAYGQISEDMATKLDAYLDVVVEQWLTDNEVAIESSLRNEVTEDFIIGMKNLFAEHYMNVPEEKVNVVEELADRVVELEERLDASINENASLKSQLLESEKNDIIDSVCEGLALTTAEKLRSLSESVEFDGDLETFKTKVEMVKENLTEKSSQKTPSTGILTEESDPEAAAGKPENKTASLAPEIRSYADAISRSVRRF
jgi:plasmid maintenance system antidote protein VapI